MTILLMMESQILNWGGPIRVIEPNSIPAAVFALKINKTLINSLCRIKTALKPEHFSTKRTAASLMVFC